MEAFSDGVLAIAITLLVLDIAVHPPGTPLEQVLHAWPAYVAYVVSFLTIGAAWLAHTALTDRLAQSDSIFLRLNLLFLLVVAFHSGHDLVGSRACDGSRASCSWTYPRSRWT